MYNRYGDSMYYVYILRCQDHSLYTGITNQIEKRLKEHFFRLPQCAKYTKSHHAKTLEALWCCENRSEASKLEYYIKQLSKDKKELLISENCLDALLSCKIDIQKYQRQDEQRYCNFI